MRVITLIHLRPDARPARVAELENAIAKLPDEVGALRRSHLGRHLRGSLGGGEYTWDALLDGPEVGALLRAPGLARLLAAGDVVERLDPVAFEPQQVALPEPDIGPCIKRTLLLRVLPGSPPERVAAFERDLLGMPGHIAAIRNWALSRTDTSLCPTRWTHVWEQEYRDVAGLEVAYMNHPYHWGLVDGWFDPECPQRIVDSALAHVYCAAPATVLGWTAGQAPRG
jgi:hypothetical protein